MTAAIIIPFRDRGTDPCRPANLKRVLQHWDGFDAEILVVSDGQTGNAQFNRSAAYNKGAALTAADVIVYTESDLIVDHTQIQRGIEQATQQPGLVIPFTRFMAIDPADSIRIRNHEIPAHHGQATQVRAERKSIGAVNIITRTTLNAIGQWDETFTGAWYDDDAMEIAFRICCGPTRFINGTAWHLHHLSGAKGQHLTAADRTATRNNKTRYTRYQTAQTPHQIRQLTAGG